MGGRSWSWSKRARWAPGSRQGESPVCHRAAPRSAAAAHQHAPARLGSVYFETVVEPLDPQVDHARGDPAGRVILEYGDYECPYSRRAYREIQRVEARLGGQVRFAFRHFPLT